VSTGTQTFAGNKTFANDLTVTGGTTLDGTVVLGDATSDTITFNGYVGSSILPDTDDTYDLGSSSLRWRDLYLGPSSLHIGTSSTDEGIISYDTTGNILQFGTDATTQGDIAFNTDQLYVDTSTGNIGIGITNPGEALELGTDGNIKTTSSTLYYDIENAVLEYPKHYRKFAELVTNTKYENDWSYIDLFQFRETNQKKIYDFYKNDVEFIVSQLKLTHKIICEINPEIIVVCNSGASNFFGINKIKKSEYWENIWLGYDFEYNKTFGIDIIKGIHNESIIKDQKQHLKNLPILFTSTLTYKSRFDKKRLNWQLNLVAENYNRNEKNNCG
jgi:hypothetical protein